MQVKTQSAGTPLLLCFSHLRWNFVTQRPQHLLRRAVRDYRVIYWEEPEFGDADVSPALNRHTGADGVTVVTPLLPGNGDDALNDRMQRMLLDAFLAEQQQPPALVWFYTPMAFGFAAHVAADTVVYDCMDELAAFAGASPRLMLLERRLMRRADLVFTGGRSLQRAKQPLHSNVHCFPSAVDCRHYAQARTCGAEPADQATIPHPRIGFFGVLDERMDTALVEAVADRRPDWHIVLIGPTAKIDEADLPRRSNIHWLGPKNYADLPAYLGCWDAGLMPFALNDATRFISPTKTPEFLAAGVPLVSTPVADVVATWSGVVSIASGADAVVSALQAVLDRPRAPWLAQVDRALAGMSWDDSWAGMLTLVDGLQAKLPVAEAGD